jgi:hypothetical protein
VAHARVPFTAGPSVRVYVNSGKPTGGAREGCWFESPVMFEPPSKYPPCTATRLEPSRRSSMANDATVA